jgi:outer membrane immunogenic protein
MIMKTLRRSGIALAVLAGSAVAVMPASADGGRGPSRPERSDYPSIWQGAYVGLHLGHGESGPADGFVGGGQVGYNWQSGQIVYGLEADVSYADISFKERFGGMTASGSIDWMATARGRLGYLLLPNLLAYGTVGFGLASGSGSASIPGFGGFSVRDTESDIVYGLGLEGKISDKISARIEYLTFGDLDIDVVRVGLNYRLGN